MQKDYVFGVVEIKKVTAVNSRGVNLPEFCWLFNDVDLCRCVLLQPDNNSEVLLELGLARLQPSDTFMDHSVLNLDYVWVLFTVMIIVAPISDGDGKWGLAGRRRPAGSGQDLLEWRTGPVQTDTNWAQTEV